MEPIPGRALPKPIRVSGKQNGPWCMSETASPKSGILALWPELCVTPASLPWVLSGAHRWLSSRPIIRCELLPILPCCRGVSCGISRNRGYPSRVCYRLFEKSPLPRPMCSSTAGKRWRLSRHSTNHDPIFLGPHDQLNLRNLCLGSVFLARLFFYVPAGFVKPAPGSVEPLGAALESYVSLSGLAPVSGMLMLMSMFAS